MPLPQGFMQWNRALRGAFLKGMYARLADESRGSCPYQDRRKPSGGLSWSRSFISAWRDGWEYADRDREDALITAACTTGGRK